MKCLVIKYIYTTLVLWLLAAGNSFSEQLIKDRVVYDFSETWLRYDKFYESYLPLKNKELRSARSIHQLLSFEKYRKYDLTFTASKGLTLFINNKLVYKKVAGKDEQVLMLMEKFEPDEKGEILITFFHPEGFLPFNSTFITNSLASDALPERTEENALVLLTRENTEALPGYVLLFLATFTLLVVFKQNYPKEYARYFTFAVQENQEHLLSGAFSIPSLWMALISGMGLSLLIYMFGLEEVIFSSPFSLFQGTVVIALTYFVFYIGKYIYLWIIAWLFNYSKVVSSQFTEYVRFFERVCLAACVVVFGLVSSGFVKVDVKSEILYYLFIILLILCVLKVIFLFFRLITHRNLYLFSYICAAEILPLIITVKILLF